uniref:Uncharacterized protein n=1 Tax=Fundulus heteroclitus TaxID=8078 RepID=A0A146QFW3_FUNHE
MMSFVPVWNIKEGSGAPDGLLAPSPLSRRTIRSSKRILTNLGRGVRPPPPAQI